MNVFEITIFGFLVWVAGIAFGYWVGREKLATRVTELETRQDPEKYNG